MCQNVNDGKLWLLKGCIVFEPRPVRVIKREDIQEYKVNRSGEDSCVRASMARRKVHTSSNMSHVTCHTPRITRHASQVPALVKLKLPSPKAKKCFFQWCHVKVCCCRRRCCYCCCCCCCCSSSFRRYCSVIRFKPNPSHPNRFIHPPRLTRQQV